MKDMTQGKPLRLILLFALPLGIGQFFQQLYTMMDVRIVGQTLGEIPLAAMGSVTPLADLLIELIIGLCNGFSIIVATYFGAKKTELLKKAVAASVIIGALSALALTGISLLFMNQFLRLLHVEESLRPLARQYADIIVAGLIFTVFYNICAGILRAVGDSMTPLILLALSSLLNVILDYAFILGLHMGIRGAAAATVFSQAISSLACVIRIIRHYPLLHIGKKDFCVPAQVFKNTLVTGFSMSMMLSLVYFGTLILQGPINSFGPYVIVAHTAARKVTSLFMLPNACFSSALSTFSGQNYGANRMDRVKTGTRDAILLVCLWDIFIMIIAYLAAPQFIRMISYSSHPEVLSTGSLYLKVDTLFYFLCTSVCCLRNSLQGMGKSGITIVSSFAELLCKALIAWFLAPKVGYIGIVWCEPVAWFVMLIPLLLEWRKINS